MSTVAELDVFLNERRKPTYLGMTVNPHVEPVYSGLHDSKNKMKLGLFCGNASGGGCSADVPRNEEYGWDWSLRLHQVADSIGFEFTVPVARWLGYGGYYDQHGGAFETLTWAAGLAASTKQITLLSTVHVAFVPPIFAAKAAATIDRISRGRFGINAVMGWYDREAEFWGLEMRGHDDRYGYGGEWTDFVTRLWSEEEAFDFQGKYFNSIHAESNPKPCRRPLLINAGISEAGVDYCAKYCDFNYGMPLPGEEAVLVQRVKNRARDVYNRKVGSLVNGYVIVADTEKEAKRLHEWYIETGDLPGAMNLMRDIGAGSQSFPREGLAKRMLATGGGIELIGTPEQVTEKLLYLSNQGIDGISLNFLNFAEELLEWDEKVVPLMRSAGLRE